MKSKFGIIMVVLGAFMVSACGPETNERTGNYILPPGMENCHIYRMRADTDRDLVAVVCKNSTTTTTYRENKTTKSVVAIDE